MPAGAKYIADSKCLLTDSLIDASFACLFSMKEERQKIRRKGKETINKMEVARKINELRAGNQVETNAWEYRGEAEKTVTDLADIMVRSRTGIMQRLCYYTCLM